MIRDWFKNRSGLEGWVAQLAITLEHLDTNGQYKEGNGDICSDEEFPNILEVVLLLILPEPNSAESNKTNANWKTNRLLVDKINEYPPPDFSTLLLAITHVSKELAQDWERAKKLGWINPHQQEQPKLTADETANHNANGGGDKQKPSNYKGSNPWPQCKHCQQVHNPNGQCANKNNQNGGGAYKSRS